MKLILALRTFGGRARSDAERGAEIITEGVFASRELSATRWT